jgi:hypothetical protein
MLVNHNYPSESFRLASRRLTRALTLLSLACGQLRQACNAAPDKHNRERLLLFASELQRVSNPISRLARRLQGGNL